MVVFAGAGERVAHLLGDRSRKRIEVGTFALADAEGAVGALLALAVDSKALALVLDEEALVGPAAHRVKELPRLARVQVAEDVGQVPAEVRIDLGMEEQRRRARARPGRLFARPAEAVGGSGRVSPQQVRADRVLVAAHVASDEDTSRVVEIHGQLASRNGANHAGQAGVQRDAAMRWPPPV